METQHLGFFKDNYHYMPMHVLQQSPS